MVSDDSEAHIEISISNECLVNVEAHQLLALVCYRLWTYKSWNCSNTEQSEMSTRDSAQCKRTVEGDLGQSARGQRMGLSTRSAHYQLCALGMQLKGEARGRIRTLMHLLEQEFVKNYAT